MNGERPRRHATLKRRILIESDDNDDRKESDVDFYYEQEAPTNYTTNGHEQPTPEKATGKDDCGRSASADHSSHVPPSARRQRTVMESNTLMPGSSVTAPPIKKRKYESTKGKIGKNCSDISDMRRRWKESLGSTKAEEFTH